MNKGLFLVLEGPEGAGKSTQREFIRKFLEAAGLKVVSTREPGGTPLAERIREILLAPSDEEMCSATELLLMFSARAQHFNQVIKPTMEAGAIVLCDRFIDSTYAYQCFGRGMAKEDIDRLVTFTLGNVRPDLTFMFDIPQEVGMKRAAARGFLDRFELQGQAFFARVATGYRHMAAEAPERYARIDGNQPIEQVEAQLVPYLQDIINKMQWKHKWFLNAEVSNVG